MNDRWFHWPSPPAMHALKVTAAGGIPAAVFLLWMTDNPGFLVSVLLVLPGFYLFWNFHLRHGEQEEREHHEQD